MSKLHLAAGLAESKPLMSDKAANHAGLVTNSQRRKTLKYEETFFQD